MSIQSGNHIIDGVDQAIVVYKTATDLEESQFYVVDSEGVPQEAALTLVVSGECAFYCINTFELSETDTYNIDGLCAPTGIPVYVSSDYEENNVSSFTDPDNIINTTVSDGDGHFTFEGIACSAGTIVVWIRVEPEYARTAGLYCTPPTTTGIDTTGKIVIYDTFEAGDVAECPICNGTGDNPNVEGTDDCSNCAHTGSVTVVDPNHKIIGKTSSNIDTLYLSLCETGTDDDYKPENLVNNVVASTTTLNYVICDECSGNKTLSDGTTCPVCSGVGNITLPDYRGCILENTCSVGSTYAVWGLVAEGEEGSVVIDEVTITNASVCLSGDTMILMANGSEQRLDSLVVGDMVMSEDHVPTRVNTLVRGRFNPHHTLYHFEDGTVIDETYAHRFYNVDQGFWQRLGNWEIGNRAVSQNGSYIALTAVERVEESAEMFGIWTESGSYYANGLLSGDASCNKRLLADATAEQAVDMMLSLEEEKLFNLIGLEGVLP